MPGAARRVGRRRHGRAGRSRPSSSSDATPPGRSSTGRLAAQIEHRRLRRRSRQGPPSRIAAIRTPSSLSDMRSRGRADSARAVGARRGDRAAARGAAMRGRRGCAGTRSASVSSPALASSEIGQSRRARQNEGQRPRPEALHQRARARYRLREAPACIGVEKVHDQRVEARPPFAAKIAATPASSVASPPRPYTVSVGKATSSPARSSAAA